ncbi:MAG: 50S ribosomal protein L23 [Planctomycetes bacterium]|nr:50S ribosomal protein L23 [Planctomycetota bacterium]
MRNDPYAIVKHPLVSEKGHRLVEEENTYPFKVDLAANKIEIKKAIESIYGVKVRSVRTTRVQGRRRRYRWKPASTAEWKKAYVTLAEGQTIEFM